MLDLEHANSLVRMAHKDFINAEISMSPSPIPRSAAVMSNGNNADAIVLQPVNQGIGKAVEWQRPRVACASFAQLGELAQEAKCFIEFVSEIVCRDERALSDVPIDSGISIGLRLAAKTDLHWFLRH